MKDAKVQTQLSFKKHTGNTVAFQKDQQQLHGAKAMTDSHKCLRSVFRLQDFRGDQEAIIRAVLEGQDSLVIMPTGGGKSLCYQLPAVMSKGLTLVVSPLLALIHDQANALKRLGIKAAALNSSITKKERSIVMTDLSLSTPTLKLLYVTPELLATEGFRKHVSALQSREMLARLVIDEAHCISEWGHDFRKDYAKLDYFRVAFPSIPILALTATATERVQQDIKTILRLPDPPLLKLFVSSFNRPNLYYEVRFDSNDDRYENFIGFLRGVYKSRRKRLGEISAADSQGSSAETQSQNVESICGIIYCGQRSTCEDLANRLVGDGFRAAAFHSGMTPKQRESVQRRWCSDASDTGNDPNEKSVDVIVATIAFGMGIDKPNVRFVCHWELPKTIEGYYQESGRAGRDGELSRCILYYSREDRIKIEFILEMEKERRLKNQKASSKIPGQGRSQTVDTTANFQKMVEYCENVNQCRHVFVCQYFGEEGVSKQTVCKGGARCDICRTPDKVTKEKAEKLSNIQGTGRSAQYMGGARTFVTPDGSVQVQGQWQTASVALGRYDADLIGDDNDDDEDAEEDDEGCNSSEDGDSSIENPREEDDDYDSEAERKAKRRKLLFGHSVDPSYYKKPAATPAPSREIVQAAVTNKYGLAHIESTKIELKFRERCYETVERALSSLFQGTHRSLSTEYLSKIATISAPPLSKEELGLRLSALVKKLALEIEKNGFDTSGTQNIYKGVLGHRVRDIKGFEAQAREALSVLSSSATASTGSQVSSSNQAWATALDIWESLH